MNQSRLVVILLLVLILGGCNQEMTFPTSPVTMIEETMVVTDASTPSPRLPTQAPTLTITATQNVKPQLQIAQMEIGASIAQEIIREHEYWTEKGYEPPDNSVIVQVDPLNASSSDPIQWFKAPYLTVWKYENKRIITATDEDVEKMKEDRNAYLIVIVIREVKDGFALVDIATQYSRSSTPGFSDGGYASHWKLKYSDEKWSVDSQADYYYWD